MLEAYKRNPKTLKNRLINENIFLKAVNKYGLNNNRVSIGNRIKQSLCLSFQSLIKSKKEEYFF